jgi:hypothetical protein
LEPASVAVQRRHLQVDDKSPRLDFSYKAVMQVTTIPFVERHDFKAGIGHVVPPDELQM